MAEPGNTIKKWEGGKLKSLRQDGDPSSLVYGRVPPQAVELEEAVLGAIMLDKDGIPTVIEILQVQSFYKREHQLIYEVMTELFDKSQAIDLLTVNEALKKKNLLEEVGGVHFLIELTNRVASAANIEYHARIIAQKFIQRELITLANNTVLDAYEDTKDVFDMLDEAEQGLYDITEKFLRRGVEAIGRVAISVQKQIEEVSKKEGGITGVPTGFKELDKITSGWQPSDLVIVAARPGMGKTSFTLALAQNAAKDHNKGVAIFSLEMANQQLVQRLISMESEIESRKLRNGQLEDYEWQQLHHSVDKMHSLPIFIDDTPAINIFELRAKCRRLKQNHDIQLVIIDYLQLMSSSPNEKRGNREQEISSISRGLKGLAKELEVPVIALSQLSRAVETRGGEKRPQLSDLRESGAIEQDADIVTFIYRPDYYDLDDPTVPKGMTEIIIAKHQERCTGYGQPQVHRPPG
jgi:replicative DNA helicase